MSKLRVVVATDGSIEADIATAVLQRLPLPGASELTVAMVTESLDCVPASLYEEAISVVTRASAESARIQMHVAMQTVSRVAERIRETGCTVEGLVLQGDIAEQLLELSRTSGATLIAAGNGVRSELASMFLGSVSRKLVLYSEASVLIGRHYLGQKAEDTCKTLKSKELLDVVIAVDGTSGSDLAIRCLEALREPAFGKIYTVCIEPISYPISAHGSGMPLAGCAPDWEHALKTAQEAADRIRDCARSVEPITAIGRPAQEICRLADERGADLVMLGASRLGAMERLVLGSCAYETATSAPCSVLILRGDLPFGR